VPPRRLARFQQQASADLSSLDDPKLNAFFALIGQFRQFSQKMPLSKLIKSLLIKIDYERYLRDGSEQGEKRWENIQELFSVTLKFDKLQSQIGLQNFLEEVAIISNHDEIESNKDLVNLMTVHCAKGLEFEVVFIAGCEEGVFPYAKSYFDPNQMEEERRLFYVGLTRAKQRAYLSYVRQRQLFGSIMINPPSRFIADLPVELTEFHQFS